jgi:DNA/RNA endonuclease YhcR with UshA esterase domain
MEGFPMRKLSILSVAGAGLLLGTALPVLAHHAFSAEFDANSPVELKGTVTRMEWINPHSWIHIDVVNEDGETESWMVEGGAPNAILRRGFTADSLKAGTVIMVEGYQARDGSMRANGRDITFEDGTKLFVGAGSRGAPDGRD